MPRSWLVGGTRDHDRADASALPLAAVAELLDAATADAEGAPATPMLRFVNRLATVDYLMLARYEPPSPVSREASGDAAGATGAPTMLQGPAREPRPGRDVTAECFGIYRRAFWRSDTSTAFAARLLDDGREAGPIVALHQRASDVPVAAWRHEIYEREHLADRFSLLYSLRPREVFAINLYRDERAGRFGTAEVERLLGIAPLIRQAHRAALRRPGPAREAALRGTRVADAERALGLRVPALSARERQVLARIACGSGADGIAAELGVAPSTVITLRKRGYGKLADAGIGGGRLALIRGFAEMTGGRGLG